MKGFDLQGLAPHVDCINVMAYDLQGPWGTAVTAEPHTNLTGKIAC